MSVMAENILDYLESNAGKVAQLELLESWFPWLGTDEDISGSDVIDRLNEWFEAVGGIQTDPADEDEDGDDND